jgi:hypothetical protein
MRAEIVNLTLGVGGMVIHFKSIDFSFYALEENNEGALLQALVFM